MAKRIIDEKRLFDAALAEFSRHSYEEASVNKIIADAGITKGSFYYRFAAKYDLYIYLLKESARRKWAFIHETTGSEKDAEKDIFDFFLVQADIAVRFAEAYPAYHDLSTRFSKEKDSPIRDKALKTLGAADEAGLGRIIEDSYKAGYFRKEYSLAFIDKLIKGLFASFYDILFKNEDIDLGKSLEHLKSFVRFMKSGLKAVD